MAGTLTLTDKEVGSVAIISGTGNPTLDGKPIDIVALLDPTTLLPYAASGGGGGGGLAVTDEAAFTAGTSQLTPTGGVFNDSAAALSSGQQGEARVTTNRALHTNLRNNAGTEIGTTANPVVVQQGNLSSTVDSVAASNETGTLYNGATALTPLFAPIVASSSGVTNILALTAGKRIRVLQVVLIANGAVNVKFQSHVTPTDLTGLFYLAANGGFSSGYSPIGQFQTVSGEALDINLSGAVAVGGYLVYVTV